ncbi:hypothetical protein AB0I81_40115 [Nonomuraea sp. NPDC050404]|uniref:hypothetical protein n=1 Tax=Nonomuraea sp. NPDC050404 TaxID=3155783 RepID=UPI0033C45AEC
MANLIEPIALADAAERLDTPRSTIGVWVHRYGVRRLGTQGRRTLVDYWDLAAVEWCLRTGRAVPATPAERAELRTVAA